MSTVKTFHSVTYRLSHLIPFSRLSKRTRDLDTVVSLTLMEMPRAWKSSACHGSARGHERHDKEPGARKAANGRKMRRKTIAKRILYTGHEGSGEQAGEARHIFCVCSLNIELLSLTWWFDLIMRLSFSTRRRDEDGEQWLQRRSRRIMLTMWSSKQGFVASYY